jgi:Tfp pilus assembly protein PilF
MQTVACNFMTSIIKRNIIFSAGGLAILTTVIMFSNLFGGQTSQKMYDEGVKFYNEGNAEKAVDKLSDAIKKETDKSNSDKRLLSNMHNMRGEVYLSVGVAILSQSDFVYALQYNPQNESSLNNLGIWFSIEHFTTPDYQKSLAYFDEAIAIQPTRKDIQLNKACVKIQSGDKTGCDDLNKLDSEGYSDAKIALQRFCNN